MENIKHKTGSRRIWYSFVPNHIEETTIGVHYRLRLLVMNMVLVPVNNSASRQTLSALANPTNDYPSITDSNGVFI